MPGTRPAGTGLAAQRRAAGARRRRPGRAESGPPACAAAWRTPTQCWTETAGWGGVGNGGGGQVTEAEEPVLSGLPKHTRRGTRWSIVQLPGEAQQSGVDMLRHIRSVRKQTATLSPALIPGLPEGQIHAAVAASPGQCGPAAQEKALLPAREKGRRRRIIQAVPRQSGQQK